MTATLATRPQTRSAARSLIGPGLVAIAAASLATTAVAATGRAAGISLDVSGAPIPVGGFATLTALFSLVGLVLAVALTRWSTTPARTFTRVTVGLTALSLIPDALADAAGPTKALLMLTHLVAASIVIPALAARLAR